MYAITLNGFGDPEVMEWAQVDDLPAPGPARSPSTWWPRG